MAEKAEENSTLVGGDPEEEIPSDRESEEGGGVMMGSDGEEVAASPQKKTSGKSPKKKKVTSAGMQIPEHWPWEEAKRLFITPDVVKGDDLEVGHLVRIGSALSSVGIQLEWKAPDVDGLVEFLCRDKGFK